MSNPVPALLADWRSLRAELRAAEEAEPAHQPITDAYGRTWTWASGDLYTHDNTISAPRDLIPSFSLPRPGLAEDNPNYAALCAICRHQEPTTSYGWANGWLVP